MTFLKREVILLDKADERAVSVFADLPPILEPIYLKRKKENNTVFLEISAGARQFPDSVWLDSVFCKGPFFLTGRAAVLQRGAEPIIVEITSMTENITGWTFPGMIKKLLLKTKEKV